MPNTAQNHSTPSLGVVIVTYNSSDVIEMCLETLLASRAVSLSVVVVDNASTDGTSASIRDWAAGQSLTGMDALPFDATAIPKPLEVHAEAAMPQTGNTEVDDTGTGTHRLTLLHTPANLGFAGGVNHGLAALAAVPGIDRFWVLNPDSVVPPQTAAALASYDPPGGAFSLMGGRVLYLDNPDMIQIDGGTLDRRTGITGNMNLYSPHQSTPPADPAAMDFITGASMVASRQFYEAVGPMREDYFLYYEEVDWALQRRDLPLAYCPQALVYHHGGSAIGSATHNRPASPFALYFKHRARLMFLRRFLPGSTLTAHAWTLAKAAQFALRGFRPEAYALLAGSFGRKAPPAVRDRLSPETLNMVFEGISPPPKEHPEHAQ